MNAIEMAPLLLPYGYSPVMVSEEDGLPRVRGWNTLRVQQAHEQTMKWWRDLHPKAGLGLVGAYNGLVPFDTDTDDRAIWRVLSQILPSPVIARRGSKGFVALYRDPTGLIAKCKRKKFLGKPDADGKRRPLVEVKVNEVVTIPPSLHRVTGEPYVWLRQKDGHVYSPFDTHSDDLSIITVEHIDAVGKALAPWCPVPKITEVTPGLTADELALDPAMLKRYQGKARSDFHYAIRFLDGLNSERNVSLLMRTQQLMKYVHHGLLDETEVVDALLGACETNGYMAKLRTEKNDHQAMWTINSGIERARDLPLQPLKERAYGSSSVQMQPVA